MDMYTVTLKELKGLMQESIFAEESSNTEVTEEQPDEEEGFQEVRRRKRHSTNETAKTTNKAAVQAKMSATVKNSPPKEVTTWNFFAPSEWLKWTLILLPPRACHMRRQLLAKQVDRCQ
jgi:hypothetical protein